MARKDQIQQITEQIKRRTTELGQVKPKYAKQVELKPEIISNDTGDEIIVSWSKWWFVPTEAFHGNYIGKQDFDTWVRANADMHFGVIETDGILLHDGAMPQYTHAYYALEVRSEAPKQLRIELDTACRINILVDNESRMTGTYPPRHVQHVAVPGGNVWIPIELYIYNPYLPNHPKNNIEIKMDLAGTFGVNNIRTQVPAVPEEFTASTGEYSDRIVLTWKLNRQMTDQDKVQIWRTADPDRTWNPIGSVDGNLTSFTDFDTYEGDQYYYKARFITREGGVSAFTGNVVGLVGSMTGTLNIELSKNATIDNDDTIGYYKTSDTVTATIQSSTPVFEDTIAVELQYPSTSGLGYYRVPVGVSGLATYNGTDRWTVDIALSGAAASGYDMTDGRAKLVAFGYMPGVPPEGWMGPGGTAGILIGVQGMTIDDRRPIVNFFIDYDRQFENEDTIAYNTNVALLVSSATDPNTYAKAYYNPDNDEHEYGYADGFKYVSDVYQIRWANDTATLTGLEEVSGNALTPWQNYAIMGNVIDPWYLVSTGDDTKAVYMQIRDRSGNESLIASDTILYITGLSNVENVVASGHYEYIQLNWDAVAGYAEIDGYYLYRNTTGTVPSQGATPYQIIGPAYGYDMVTGYTDHHPDVTTGADYSYWVKAYIGEGTNPEDHILSADYSTKLTTGLRTDPPSVDELVTGEGLREGIHVQWRVPIGDGPDKTASEHHIYRCHTNFPTYISNSDLIQVIGYVGTGETFDFYDTSAPLSSSYRYASVAKNGPWLGGTTYYADTGNVNWTDALQISDDPPQAPLWATSLCYAGPWGVKLSWNNNRTLWPTVDDDVQGYTVYMALGEGAAFASASGLANVSCPDEAEEYVHHVVHNDVMGEDKCTFWVVAYDYRQSGELSAPLSTGAVPVYPNAPEWVSGDSYASYGYNHLVWEGGGDDYGFQAGYNVYRAIRDKENPPLNNGLEYATGTYGAVLVATIEDARSDAGYRLEMNDEIPVTGWGSEHCYWVSAVNQYGYESDAPLLTGLGHTMPNFEGFFHNYIDNGSFERDAKSDTWTINENTGRVYLVTGVGGEYDHPPSHGNVHLFCRGTTNATYEFDEFQYDYLFVQGGKDYCLSFYALRPESWAGGREFRTVVEWYNVSGELVDTDLWDIGQSELPTQDLWTRMDHTFSAPTTASHVTLHFGFEAYGYDRVYLDAFQWEESTDESPRDFVDSQNLSADKILAHSIVADMIRAGSINATHIQSETISSYHIRVGSITLDRLESMPGTPETRFSLDSHSNSFHQIEIATTGGTPYISNDQGTTWHPVVFSASVPAGWTKNSDYLVTGPDNDDEYHLYLSEWPTAPANAEIKISEANTYPADAAQIIARAVNHLESEENGGFFEIHEWAGPGVQIHGNAIVAGTIHGKYIEAETISGEKITAGSITADKLQVGVLPTVAQVNFDIIPVAGYGVYIYTHDLGQAQVSMTSGEWASARFEDPGSRWSRGTYLHTYDSLDLNNTYASHGDTYYLWTDNSAGDSPIYINTDNEPQTYLGDHVAYFARLVVNEDTQMFEIKPPTGDIYINSGEIQANSIHTTHIRADAITADEIAAQAIEAQHLTVGLVPTFAATNFTLEQNWTVYGINITMRTPDDSQPQVKLNSEDWVDVEFSPDPGNRWARGSNYHTYDTLILEDEDIGNAIYHGDMFYFFSDSDLEDDPVQITTTNVPNQAYPGNHSFFLCKLTLMEDGVHKHLSRFKIEPPNTGAVVIASGDILANSVHAEHVTADTISGGNIIGQSVTADKLMVVQKNLLRNGNFDHFESNEGVEPYHGMGARTSLACDPIQLYPYREDWTLAMGEYAPAGPHAVRFNGTSRHSGPRHQDTSGNFPMGLPDPTAIYTFSYMCKVNSASASNRYPQFNLRPKGGSWDGTVLYDWHMIGDTGTIPYIRNWNNYADDNGWVTLYTWIGPTASGADWEPLEWGTGVYKTCRMAHQLFKGGSGGDEAHDMYIANMQLVRGKVVPVPYQRAEFDSTIIAGGSIRTGSINTRDVKIYNTAMKVDIDEKGITVGDQESAGEYSRLNASHLRFSDEDNLNTFYDNKTYIYTNIIVSEPYQRNMIDVPASFNNTLLVIPSLQTIQPFYRDANTVHTWKYGAMMNTLLAGWAGPGIRSNVYLYAAMADIDHFGDFGAKLAVSGCDWDEFVGGQLDIHTYSMYIATGDYSNFQSSVNDPDQLDYDDRFITHMGDESGGDHLATHNCFGWMASMRIFIHAPNGVTNFTFHWGMASYIWVNTSHIVAQMAIGSKTISLASGESFIWHVPHYTLSRHFNDTYTANRACTILERVVYESETAVPLQMRLWTEDTSQQVIASGLIYRDIDLGGGRVIDSCCLIHQYDLEGGSPYTSNKWFSPGFVASCIVKEV